MDDRTIYIVSGLPRSGTSMMMQILEAGGLPVMTDGIRGADIDNPRGYYEYETAKKIGDDASWLSQCHGSVFKMVSALLYHLPVNYTYKIFFMERELHEVIRSQKIMLERRSQTGSSLNEDELRQKFMKHLADIKNWLAAHRNIEVIYIKYNDIINNPEKHIKKINKFAGKTLNKKNMLKAVDKGLHRNVSGK